MGGKEARFDLLALLVILVITIFSMYFVFAEHVITTSSGGTSFSLNETIVNLYNISVNNTDAATASNITEVNITIPSTFTYVVSTNGTNCSNDIVFTNTTTVLSWDNATAVVNGTNVNYFWFNATAYLPGTYNITITTTNTTGSFSTNISVTINDTTNPTASFGTNPVSNKNSSNGNITFDLKCADDVTVDAVQLWSNFSGTWVANQTNATPINNTYWNVSVTNIPDGKYIWGVYCNDTAANADWTATNRTLTVDSTGPTATLGTNPLSTYNSSSASVTFDLKCADDVEADFIQLYTNFTGTWAVNSTNSTPVNNTYWNVSLVGILDGRYIFGVYCNDSGGSGDWAENRTVTIDTTDPTATLECTPTTVVGGNTITCSCAATDATSGVLTNSYTVYPSTLTDGEQTTNCGVTDYAGNTATSTVTYTVTPSGSSTSSGGGSSATFWTRGTYTVPEGKIEEGYTKQISAKQRLKLSIGGGTHYVGVKSLTSNTATIEVTSTPQEKLMSIGEIWKVEIDSDNYYDLSVKLNSIEDDKADITTTSIHEEIPQEVPVQEEEKEANSPTPITGEAVGAEEGESGNLTWLVVLIGIVIVLIIIFFIILKKK